MSEHQMLIFAFVVSVKKVISLINFRDIFHPLYENDREKFFENGGISFIVVRDPFERLVSAYLVTFMINVFTITYILF